jgi:hypothetical protein
MKKEEAKRIRDIADTLPPVFEQHASGGDIEDRKIDGKEQKVLIPNVYPVLVNHERRLRHAYQKDGMKGIMSYLDSVHKLQQTRNEKALKDHLRRKSDFIHNVYNDPKR